jgi:hypothetical protein
VLRGKVVSDVEQEEGRGLGPAAASAPPGNAAPATARSPPTEARALASEGPTYVSHSLDPPPPPPSCGCVRALYGVGWPVAGMGVVTVVAASLFCAPAGGE